jgi:hypothetical protein
MLSISGVNNAYLPTAVPVAVETRKKAASLSKTSARACAVLCNAVKCEGTRT